MIEIGSFIKLERTKRNMTQGELSEGIVSLSYLSKIENKKTKASPEIIQLLCDRLGIEVMDETDLQIEGKCKEWYDMLFDRYDKHIITAKYEELQQLMNRSINNHTLMFEIHQIRYFIVLRDLGKALQKMNELHDMVDSFNYEERYYWHKFKGDYYSHKEDYDQAMRDYKLAEEKFRLANINEEEIADLHYALSIVHSKLWEILEAIDYAKQAMKVFQQNYSFIRCAQCHILLGISYQRIKKPDRAIKNFNLAMNLGKLSNNEDIIHLAHHNLGYFHSMMGNSEEAIKHYLIATENKDLTDKTKLEAITRLIQELYTIGDYKKAKACLQQAKEILELAKCKYDKFYNNFYDYIIQVYTYLLNGDLKKFRSLLADDFIPYLKQQEDYRHLVFYAELLAVHLEKMGKYKESVQYYKLANRSYDKLIKL
ncbi:helix-turn-helix domain-containing protein [Virgibacillus proomii]|uniref:helix-turn-helix domain-containing protein n=1 Tax=Virgibacillus proomii TaxID=84407 RepID=UPI001C118559|nr:helix-turn-helix transcriptional regulator [Virgibacillus proomii]MBU5266782.1 helix-turn-helix transcriptional regulator [Virgibacillus proomii]